MAAIPAEVAATRLELIREGIAAFAEGDHDRAAGMFAVDGEIRRVDQLGTVRGREAIRAWLAPDAIEPVHAAVTTLQENGGRVLATCDYRVRGTESGVEVADTLYAVFTFDGTQVSRMELYFDAHQAAAAAGLGG